MFRGQLNQLKGWLETIEWPSIVGVGLLTAFLFLVPGNAVRWYAEHPPQQQAETASKPQRPHDERPHEAFWVRSFTDPVAAFTLVLAISTIGLWIVTWLTLRHGRVDAKRQSSQTEASLKLARDEFDASHRPWVAFDIHGHGSLEWNQDGDFLLPIFYRLKNTGNVPALNVDIRAKLYVPFGTIDFVDQATFATEGRVKRPPRTHNFGNAIFPNDVLITGANFQISQTVIDDYVSYMKRMHGTFSSTEYFSLSIIGSVDYWSAYQEDRYQTGFVFSISKRDPSGRGKWLSFKRGVPVSAEDVSISPSPGGGGLTT